MNLYRKQIYPTSDYHGSVENNQLLKDLLIPAIKEYSSDPDKNKPPNGWLTDNMVTSFSNEEVSQMLTDDSSEIGAELKKQYFKVLNGFFDKDFVISLDQMWYNVYSNGEYQESHTHLGGPNNPLHFACVHYLSFNPQIHTLLAFTDPLTRMRNFSVEMDSHNYSEKHRPLVQEGDFLMFPSWLEHEVKAGPPTPEYPRISIAFNITVTKYGSDE